MDLRKIPIEKNKYTSLCYSVPKFEQNKSEGSVKLVTWENEFLSPYLSFW